jgi:hypothetical protein
MSWNATERQSRWIYLVIQEGSIMIRRSMSFAIAALVCSNAAVAAAHYSKTVSQLEMAISDCYFFQLTGVGESDPVTPNSPWFAILVTQSNAKEMLTLLIAARTAGMPLQRVMTNGQTVCGHAQVSTIDF